MRERLDGGPVLPRGDRSYRRGIVLGLTLAEVFLILLFLLLLALAAAAGAWESERRDLEQTVTEQTQKAADFAELSQALRQAGLDAEQATALLALRDEFARAGVPITEIEPLVAAQQKAQAAERTAAELRPLAEVGQAVAAAAAAAGVPPAKIVEALKAVPPASPIWRDLPQLAQRLDELQEAAERADQLQERLENTQQVLTQALQGGGNAARAIEQLAAAKGIDPSCWYDENGDEVFLFDVAVFDDFIVIENRDVPREFRTARAALPPVRVGKRLTNAEFLAETKEIRRRAQEREVQQYRCVFYVAVWDKTNVNAKERWKVATEGIVGQNFYRLTQPLPKPWPHRQSYAQ